MTHYTRTWAICWQDWAHCRTLVLVFVLWQELISNIGNGIPRVVDTDEQHQNGNSTNDEQRRFWLAGEDKRGDDKRRIGDKREYCMPQSVFQHRLIASLTAQTPQNDYNVCYPA